MRLSELVRPIRAHRVRLGRRPSAWRGEQTGLARRRGRSNAL